MVGPSAIGSENGTPSSITSAPASTSACMTGTSDSSEGSPAVMKGISALRLADLRWANLVSMRFLQFLPRIRANEHGYGKSGRNEKKGRLRARAGGENTGLAERHGERQG